jgi:hypothetical protein
MKRKIDDLCKVMDVLNEQIITCKQINYMQAEIINQLREEVASNEHKINTCFQNYKSFNVSFNSQLDSGLTNGKKRRANDDVPLLDDISHAGGTPQAEALRIDNTLPVTSGGMVGSGEVLSTPGQNKEKSYRNSSINGVNRGGKSVLPRQMANQSTVQGSGDGNLNRNHSKENSGDRVGNNQKNNNSKFYGNNSRNKNVTIGKSKSQDLKAAPRLRWFYAGRWENSSDVEKVKQFIEKFIPVEEIEQLNTNKHGWYKSYKFKCDTKHSQVIFNSDNWPEGVFVKIFYEAKKPSEQQNKDGVIASHLTQNLAETVSNNGGNLNGNNQDMGEEE